MPELPDIQNEANKTNKEIFNNVGKAFQEISKFIGQINLEQKAEKEKQQREKAEAEKTNPTVTQKLSNNASGFVFGTKNGGFITKSEDMDGHILVVGGVGSGKSSRIAIPTLKKWNSRVFAIDIKGELYEKTKPHKSNIKVFNPQDENSYGYDPYYLLRNSKNPAQEAEAIAQSIIPLPPDIKDPFWIESAQSILTGAILHYYKKEYSFIDTLDEMQRKSPPDLIEIISESSNEKAQLYVNTFVGMEDKTLSSIFANLKSLRTLVTDDEIVSALSKPRENCITPADLDKGYDVYINIPEYLLRQWKSLLTLMVNQFITFFERREENNKTPILFLLDEFPRLGKIPSILEALATLRSKKITICPIIQSLAQLDVIYGEKERKVISDTCSYKAVLSATDADTQEYFSKLVGTYEKSKTSSSMDHDPTLNMPSKSGTQTSTEEKRIIKPEEFATLKDIVLFTPHGFFRVDKAPYYKQNNGGK